MKEKKKSAVSWILTWAGQKRSAYVWSVLLAIGNVIFKILPYFIIADVVKLFLNGEKEFEKYLIKAVLIALSFVIAELFHSLSTSLSHKATFVVLANIRKACCDKLARVPLGYVKDTPSGTFKNIMVERIDSIETTLAHIVPEFTSNLLAPVVILIYFFLTDYRLALWSLVPIVVGLFSYFGMMLDYKPSFERTVKTTKELNDAAVEYIDGIEVIKAFGKTESSYAKFTKAARKYADSFISWMRRCSVYHALMMVVTPYTLLTVLPFGAYYVSNKTLELSDFVICIILSLGIVGPLITVGSYTDDLGKIGVIVDEIAGILEQPELKRPDKSKDVPKDNSIILENVRFGYHDKEILHGVNMELKAGTVNAIVGPSGSGKSTIAKLIASLWDVDSGSIKIGGVDVKELALTDFNRKIAYVAQDNYLFNETVRENIRQGNPNATDEQVVEVTKKSGEGAIRQKIIEDDLVEAIVAMPTQLFYSVTIPVTLWFITKNKKQKGKTLFIDARNLGHMVDRKHRDLSEEDIHTIANTVEQFQNGILEDKKGFCAVVDLDEIKKQDFILTPGRYVGFEEQEDDDEPFEEKMARLTSELSEMFEKSHELEKEIREKLGAIGYEI